jgi:hypothetical protein
MPSVPGPGGNGDPHKPAGGPGKDRKDDDGGSAPQEVKK